MALTTEVFRYAGVDLRSLGLYMSLVDGALNSPPLRGSNILIPYQPGQRWVPKYYDQRHIVLAGELISLQDRIDFQAKIDTLKALFPIGSGEQKLEIQRADGTFRYCMAEVINTMGLQWLIFPTRSSPYSIELIASDPYWYGSSLQGGGGTGAWVLDSGVRLDDGVHFLDNITTLFAQILTAQVTVIGSRNSGTGVNRKPIFILGGPVVNPKITNMRNGYSIQIFGDHTPDTTLTIDCGLQTAFAGAQLLPNTIELGQGQTDWMHLEPGENPLQIDLGATPSIPVSWQASYSPAYL